MNFTGRSLLLLLFLGIALQAQDDGRPRGISSDASKALSAGITYNPPPPEPPKPVEEEKPQNEIVRLPDYAVLGRKPAVFNDNNLYKGKQLGKSMSKSFLSELDRSGLNKFTLPWESNEKRAMQAYYDSERLKNIQETQQHVSMYEQSGDSERAEAAKEDSYSTAYRPSSGGMMRDRGTWYGEQR